MDRIDPRRLEQFFLRCPDMVCVIGDGSRFEDVNPAWEKTLGYRPEELAGRPLLDLIHPEDRARGAESVAALLDGQRGGAEAIELRGVCKDGSHRRLLWNAWATPGEQLVYAIVHDLSATRQIEEQLRAEMEFNKAVLEGSPSFFVAIGKDGKTLMMNNVMRTALGLLEEEVIGRDYLELCVPPRDHEALRQVFGTLTAQKVPTVNENRVRAKDGREILVEWHGRPYLNPSGEPDYFIGVGIEIGEHRRVEEALRRSEQKLSLHIQQTPLGVIEWDRDFKVVDWNPSAERIFGYAKEEALGRHAVGLIIPEHVLPLIGPLWQALLEQKGGERVTNENITKDGRAVVCEWYNTPVVDASGQVIGVISLVDDVTEQEELAAELRLRDRAQAATIERLSTPVIEVWDGILALPIIGAIDDERAGRMTVELLQAIVRTRSPFTLVDLTGMDGVTATNAEHLLRMVRATELLGSRCLISGISPSAAQAMISLGIALTGLTTFGTLRDALSFALENARVKARG